MAAVTIKSDILKAMVDKISKGTDQVDIHIVSTYVSIEALAGDLILRTTDGTHMMKIKAKGVIDSETAFYACVPNQLFCKLITKLNAANIQLSLTEVTLEVKSGNSDYSLPLSIDPASENGAVYRMVDIPFETTEETVDFTITLEQLKNVLNFNAMSTSNRDQVAAIMANYYVDSKGICTYDGTFCENNIPLNERLRALLPLKFIGLCQVFDSASIKFELNSDKVRVTAGNDELTYKLASDKFDINSYPIDKLRSLIDKSFSSTVSVSRADLIDALDRLSLFNKDEKAVIVPITLIFAEDKLTVYDARNKNIDIIKYVDSKNAQKFQSDVSLTVFKNLLACHTNDSIKLSYDVTNNIGMMIADKEVNQLIPYSYEEA